MIGLAIQGVCTSIPMAAEDAHRVELCIVEAVNNVIEHAYGHEEGHDVSVVISVDCDRVTLEVLDTGNSMDWKSAQERRADAFLLDEGGRGLGIMESCMDRVSYRRVGNKNVLTLVKDIGIDLHP